MRRMAIALLIALALAVPGMAEPAGDAGGEPALVESVIIPNDGGARATLPGKPLLSIQDDAASTEEADAEEKGYAAGAQPTAQEGDASTEKADAEESGYAAGAQPTAQDDAASTEEADAEENGYAAEAQPTAQDAAAMGDEGAAVQAPPVGDPRVPVWDDTTQQSGAPFATDGDDAPAEGAGGEVPSVIMTLDKPALPLEGVKIGIDPGHQARGNNEKETVAPNSGKTKPKVSSGTSGAATHIAEYVTVLQIALKLRDALEAQGAEVYMTRETHDVNISNQQRAKMMNDIGVDLVLRIHCDGADNRSKHGIALYCSKSNSIAAESYRAAEAILPAVCAATGAKSNGIVSNDNYTGQNWSTVPCIMVECGFLSNPDEDRLLNDEAYQQKLAEGLMDGIAAYIQQRDG